MTSQADKANLPYRRILLKLSGEALQDSDRGRTISGDALDNIASQLKQVHDLGIQIAIVVGGGNIYRGLSGQSGGIDRSKGDYMGMLATLINGMALEAALQKAGLEAVVMSAIEMPKIADPITGVRVLRHLEQGRIAILSAGTGNPYFTTDTAAALRASEIKADALLKATKVDGVYSADPHVFSDAERYKHITYADALQKQLKVMDAAAFSLCMENKIPIVVFNFFKENEVLNVVYGKPVGTVVSEPMKEE